MRRLEEAREGKENHMLPFLWLHGEPQADILDEIGKIASCGIGAFCVEARPHPDFAGERWWSDMDAIMREARARGMRVWLLDDNRFPTGNANHAFRDKCPEKAKIYLGERHVDIIGPAKGHSLLIAPLLPEDAELLGVLALPKPDGATLAVRMEGAIDLAPRICDGFAHFDLPKGRHRLFALFATRTGGGREHYMNIIDKDSVRVLIDEVYEPHYARYKDDFGKTFAGFFSDEPEFGNTPGYDFCGSLGKRDVRLPWSAALDGALRLRWGGAFARSLPALWYEAGRETAAIRHAYMDEATKLVRGCLSGQLSAWCEERGVEYIGHTIEDDNAHARLGCGAGHFFREQGPKHMGGVDVVHCQILPGFTEPVHQWIAGDGDGEFFHFALAKLASSAARIDPKKRGRAMCEIFGNYGWAEGVGLMRWLADHMLVRGINQFVPHAFSPRYPEPDCPPHFFSRGSNPQFRFFSALARYMNRAAHLLSGGTRLPEAAILYHGDMEWAGKAMLSQKPARALLERRLDFDIVPADVFADGSAAFGGGLFSVNGAAYKSIVVPSCQYLPRHAADGLARASQKGVPVFFVGKRPSADTQAAPLPERFSSCGAAVPLAKLAGAVEKAAPPDLRVACASKELRVFSAEQPDGRALMFFNESVSRRIEAPVHAPAGRFGTYARYDGVNDALLRRRLVGDRFMLRLGPGESALYVLEKGGHIGGDGIGGGIGAPQRDAPGAHSTHGSESTLGGSGEIGESDEPCAARRLDGRRGESAAASVRWDVLAADGNSARFKKAARVEPGMLFPDMNAPGFAAGTARVYRYECAFCLPERPFCEQALYFPAFSDGVDLAVNGKSAGMLLGGSGQLDVSGLLRGGQNSLRVEIAGTLLPEKRDYASVFMQTPPAGMAREPILYNSI